MAWFQVGRGQRMESEEKVPKHRDEPDEIWRQKVQREIEELGRVFRAWLPRR